MGKATVTLNDVAREAPLFSRPMDRLFGREIAQLKADMAGLRLLVASLKRMVVDVPATLAVVPALRAENASLRSQIEDLRRMFDVLALHTALTECPEFKSAAGLKTVEG